MIKTIGYLFSIKYTIQNQLITDISVLLNGETITSNILKTMLDKLQKETFTPISLYTKPNKLSTLTKYMINIIKL
jgi:hypothetical protein